MIQIGLIQSDMHYSNFIERVSRLWMNVFFVLKLVQSQWNMDRLLFVWYLVSRLYLAFEGFQNLHFETTSSYLAVKVYASVKIYRKIPHVNKMVWNPWRWCYRKWHRIGYRIHFINTIFYPLWARYGLIIFSSFIFSIIIVLNTAIYFQSEG